MSKPGYMRDQMPTVAAFIDDLRSAFGADAVDPSIRAGMRGQPDRFHAIEGDAEIGTAFTAQPITRPGPGTGEEGGL